MRRWQWVFCALLAAGAFFYQGIPVGPSHSVVLVGATPAHAQKRADSDSAKKKRAIRRCVDYRQEQRDDGLRIRLRNDCGFELSCTVSWRVRCDEDEPETQRRKAETLLIDEGVTDGVYASAAACGDDGWRVSSVRWTCRDAAE